MVNDLNTNTIRAFKIEMSRFIMPYKFAVDEISTKINILKEEFHHLHEYNPIEHVSARVKTVESIIKKVNRRGIDLSISSIKKEIKDIAGVRVTCSFTSDIYKLKNMIESQQDIRVMEVKDYFKNPKPNGYRSLHMLVEIPIFLSNRVEHIPVEIQIRTIAMDFWASLEHKIFYKYNHDIPTELTDELREAATIATDLDAKMERLNRDISVYKNKNIEVDDSLPFNVEDGRLNIPIDLLESFVTKENE